MSEELIKQFFEQAALLSKIEAKLQKELQYTVSIHTPDLITDSVLEREKWDALGPSEAPKAGNEGRVWRDWQIKAKVLRGCNKLIEE